MAECTVVICDALCFLRCKFGKVPVKQLKSILMDFYSVDLLSEAKRMLLKDVEHLKDTIKLPHLPARRDSDNRLGREVDDILTIFIRLDEHKMIDKLPKYVSENPDKMPSVRLCEGDLNLLLSMLHKFSDKLEELGVSVAAITGELRDLQVSLAPTCSQQRAAPPTGGPDGRVSQSADPQLRSHTLAAAVVGNPSTVSKQQQQPQWTSDDFPALSEPGRRTGANLDWAAAAVSTPCPTANRYAILASTTDDDRDERDAGQFVDVSSRRRNRGKRRLSASQGQNLVAGKVEPTEDRRRPRAVYGKSLINSNISAAQKLRKKAVFCVDNVNAACSAEQMESFVASCMAVEVVTCFEVKPRRRRNDPEVNRKAFRVCVNDEDRQRFLNPTSWPDSVVVSEWVFKQRTDRVENEEDKRRRIGSDENRVSVQSYAPRQSSDDTAAVVADVSTACRVTNLVVADVHAEDEVHVVNEDTILVANMECQSDNDGE